jgi:hypothetical protein
MDREGFRAFLEKRKLNEEQITASSAIAESYEHYLLDSGGIPGSDSVWEFARSLIQQGRNTYENLLALARYGRFIKNDDLYVGVVQLLDGAEAQLGLFKKVGETFSEKLRDQAFGGIGISPMGLPPIDKPFDMFPVIDRLTRQVGNDAVAQLLSDCLRDLPGEFYPDEVEKFHQAVNIDAYLEAKHHVFVQELERCRQEGVLFFTQEVNDRVIDYVRDRPEIECGVREGNLVYITKIPYNTKQFLEESNPTLKRYYACHCPLAREAIKAGNISLDPVFCNCSAGFSKKPWEIILGRPLKVEMLESAIKGDSRCRFAVHLPEDVLLNE